MRNWRRRWGSNPRNLHGSAVFETTAIDHSATPPWGSIGWRRLILNSFELHFSLLLGSLWPPKAIAWLYQSANFEAMKRRPDGSFLNRIGQPRDDIHTSKPRLLADGLQDVILIRSLAWEPSRVGLRRRAGLIDMFHDTGGCVVDYGIYGFRLQAVDQLSQFGKDSRVGCDISAYVTLRLAFFHCRRELCEGGILDWVV